MLMRVMEEILFSFENVIVLFSPGARFIMTFLVLLTTN